MLSMAKRYGFEILRGTIDEECLKRFAYFIEKSSSDYVLKTQGEEDLEWADYTGRRCTLRYAVQACRVVCIFGLGGDSVKVRVSVPNFVRYINDANACRVA